jgi:hypothetical protein
VTFNHSPASKADIENNWSITSILPLCLSGLCGISLPNRWRHIIEFARTITERLLSRLRCSFSVIPTSGVQEFKSCG